MFLVDKLVKPLSNRISFSDLTGSFSESIQGLYQNVAAKSKVLTACQNAPKNNAGGAVQYTNCNALSVSSSSTITGLPSATTISSHKCSGSLIPIKTSGSTTLTFVGLGGVAKDIILSDGTHLPCQEGSGTTLYDVSGNGNNGTATSTSWTTSTTSSSYNTEHGFSVAGAVKVPALKDGTADAAGNAITNPKGYVHNDSEVNLKIFKNHVGKFDGVDAHAVGAVIDSGDLTPMVDDADLEIHFTPTNVDAANHTAQVIGGLGKDPWGGAFFTLYLRYDQLWCSLRVNNTNTRVQLQGVTLTNNTHYQIRITYDGSTLTAYNFGTQFFSSSVSGGNLTTQFIGYKPTVAAGTVHNSANIVYPFGGEISFIRLKHFYEYDFKEGATTTLTDKSGGGRDATINVGASGTVTDAAGFWASSYSTYTKAQLASHSSGTGNLYLAKAGTFITKLVQYDTDITLTADEQEVNNAYFSA